MNDQERVKSAQSLKQLRDALTNDLPQEMELAALLAKALKIRYDAFIKQGFSPEQALYLTKL